MHISVGGMGRFWEIVENKVFNHRNWIYYFLWDWWRVNKHSQIPIPHFPNLHPGISHFLSSQWLCFPLFLSPANTSAQPCLLGKPSFFPQLTPFSTEVKHTQTLCSGVWLVDFITNVWHISLENGALGKLSDLWQSNFPTWNCLAWPCLSERQLIPISEVVWNPQSCLTSKSI